jgi:hypothetical protein
MPPGKLNQLTQPVNEKTLNLYPLAFILWPLSFDFNH